MKKWLIRALAATVMAVVCVRLGMWQLDRNEQRSSHNAIIEANTAREPVPLTELTRPGEPVDAGEEWRQVQISGRYDTENELRLRLRPVDGQPGVHALTPLVTADGTAVLVDRGFLPTDGPDEDVDLPTPPSGEVTVIGRIRESEEGRGTGGDPASGAIRYIDVEALAGTMPYPLHGGWVELVSQQPPAGDELQLLPEPETEAGPHLSYAVQWFLFAAIGIGGFIVLIRVERRDAGATKAPSGTAAPPDSTEPVDSQRAGHLADHSDRQVP